MDFVIRIGNEYMENRMMNTCNGRNFIGITAN